MGMFTVSKVGRKRKYRSDWLATAKSDRKVLGLKCEKCGSLDRVERHHTIHKSRGGADNLLNMTLLCHFCHKRHHRR